MYKVSHFIENNNTAVFDFMREHSFALVTGIGDKYPVASQLPLEILQHDEELFLTGHLMRKTDHHLAFENNPNVLVIFNSAEAFIDASWYAKPEVASTVNYMSVQAQGQIAFLDEQGTYEAIKQVTNKHVPPGSPGSFENIPSAYIDDMLKAIVGFRIKVTNLQHVFKLSQNRSKSDLERIISQLHKRGTAGDIFIAGEIQKRI
jgi:transcriptional regulator